MPAGVVFPLTGTFAIEIDRSRGEGRRRFSFTPVGKLISLIVDGDGLEVIVVVASITNADEHDMEEGVSTVSNWPFIVPSLFSTVEGLPLLACRSFAAVSHELTGDEAKDDGWQRRTFGTPLTSSSAPGSRDKNFADSLPLRALLASPRCLRNEGGGVPRACARRNRASAPAQRLCTSSIGSSVLLSLCLSSSSQPCFFSFG